MGAYVGQGVEGRGVGDGRDREWRRGMGECEAGASWAERRGPGSQVSQWGGTHDVLHRGEVEGIAHDCLRLPPGQQASPCPLPPRWWWWWCSRLGGGPGYGGTRVGHEC